MRGNPPKYVILLAGSGSIPAHAGQPAADHDREQCRGVYPRACGATKRGLRRPLSQKGLSPRMRGNQAAILARAGPGGSIPAHAGQPGPRGCCRLPCRVYPRACGATASGHLLRSSLSGLSPRMRGNLLLYGLRIGVLRSIPAHAGQPSSSMTPTKLCRVYPRACGATCHLVSLHYTQAGLSPRMRGNLVLSPQQHFPVGSIPAHAGQPVFSGSGLASAGVYPRACGATQHNVDWIQAAAGLSPRMRGNQLSLDAENPELGSIPAHAGQPMTRREKQNSSRVYPRACGATDVERYFSRH